MIIHNREKTLMTVPPAPMGSFVRVVIDPIEGTIRYSDGNPINHAADFEDRIGYYDTLANVHYDALPNESVWIVPGTAPGE